MFPLKKHQRENDEVLLRLDIIKTFLWRRRIWIFIVYAIFRVLRKIFFVSAFFFSLIFGVFYPLVLFYTKYNILLWIFNANLLPVSMCSLSYHRKKIEFLISSLFFYPCVHLNFFEILFKYSFFSREYLIIFSWCNWIRSGEVVGWWSLVFWCRWMGCCSCTVISWRSAIPIPLKILVLNFFLELTKSHKTYFGAISE